MNIDIIGIVENKDRFSNIDRIASHCLPNWHFIHNGSSNTVSRVWFCWRDTTKCSLLATHDEATSCIVDDGNKISVITVVYGRNKAEGRKALWHHLLNLKGLVGSSPWVLLGDFNVIRQASERIGSSHVDYGAMDDFNHCLEELDAEEYPGKGFYFTCCNKSDNGMRIYSRLDRIFVNEEWFNYFPEAAVEFLAPSTSDHSLVFITWGSNVNYGPKPSNFRIFWMQNPKFQETLRSSWADTEDNDDSRPVQSLCSKLRKLKSKLKELKKRCYSACYI